MGISPPGNIQGTCCHDTIDDSISKLSIDGTVRFNAEDLQRTFSTAASSTQYELLSGMVHAHVHCLQTQASDMDLLVPTTHPQSSSLPWPSLLARITFLSLRPHLSHGAIHPLLPRISPHALWPRWSLWTLRALCTVHSPLTGVSPQPRWPCTKGAVSVDLNRVFDSLPCTNGLKALTQYLASPTSQN